MKPLQEGNISNQIKWGENIPKKKNGEKNGCGGFDVIGQVAEARLHDVAFFPLSGD